MSDKKKALINPALWPQNISDDRVEGLLWSAWLEEGRYYYECDMGSHAMKLVTFEISKDEFEGLKNLDITSNDLSSRCKREARRQVK